MPELPQVIPGEIIASGHINDLNNRVVSRYQVDGDRPATPGNGEMAYVSQDGTLNFWNGTVWVAVAYQGFVEQGVPVTLTDTSDVQLIYTVTGSVVTLSWMTTLTQGGALGTLPVGLRPSLNDLYTPSSVYNTTSGLIQDILGGVRIRSSNGSVSVTLPVTLGANNTVRGTMSYVFGAGAAGGVS